MQPAINIAGFLNENFGIMAGYEGETHYMVDGGKTWALAQNSSMCRHGLDIVDAKLAWTTGESGNVRVSKDGGQTWQAVADVGIVLSQFICFIDDTNGWVADSSLLFNTGDGGQKWTAVTFPKETQSIAAISLRTASEGYVLGQDGSLYVTADGGESWTAKPLGLGKKIITSAAFPVGAIRFTDPGHGVVIVGLEDTSGAFVALWTTDGGNSWTRESLPAKFGMLFLTHDAGFLTDFGMDKTITLFHHQSSAGK
jgi:photosystem II stability/assembly factor-like uncharacterized protein